MDDSKCPGIDRLRDLTIVEKLCPRCGSIIEVFSVDTEAACEKCGFVVSALCEHRTGPQAPEMAQPAR